MRTSQVFVSHTSDLAVRPQGRSFVQAALDAVARAGMAPVDMRYFAARDGRPADYCRARVRQCEVFVAVVGLQYGSVVPDRAVSYTELEFEEATEAGIPRLVFLLGDEPEFPSGHAEASDARVERFRQRLRESGLVVRSFTTCESLELEVFHALSELGRAGTPPSTWLAAAARALPRPDYPGGHQVPIDLPPDTALSAVPPTVLHTLPRDQAAFTGRIRELDQILSVTEADAGSVGIYAVDGMAGIGKTALAVHAARRLAARFPDGQIFIRLHAHTEGQRPVDPAEALATLLLWTGAAPQQIPPGLDARAAAWRHQLTGKKMLLVLDDATGSDQVGPLLPGSANCLVLVTSRRRLTALEEVVPISLDTLPHADATELFARLAGRRDIRPSNDAIAEIVALCGYLPLAIRLVAAGLRHHPSWTVTGVARELSASHDRLTAMRAEDISVTAAFDLSYRDLTTSQQRLFRRLGLHPGNDVDAYAAAALDDADLQVTRQHLGDLHDHNLVSEPTRGRYLLHELLREHARTLAASSDSGEDNAAVDRLLDYYLHAAVAAGRHLAWRTATVGPTLQGRPPAWAPELRTAEEAIAWLNTERVNLRRCAEHAAASGRLEHANRIPAAIGDFLHAQGHWNEALTLHQLALATARTAGDRAGQAAAFHSLGTMQRLTGDSAAAMTSQTLAVELFRDLGDRQGQARALNQLGIVQRHTGDNAAGAISHGRALELFRDLGDRQGQARALNSLGVMQQTLGDYEASADSERQALSLFCEVGDQDGQARALNFLGVAQQLAGDYPAAGISLTDALDLFREIGDRLGQADALINLGALLSRTSDFQDANHHYTEALNVSREVNAPFQEARALEGIGLCRIREGTPGEGAPLLRQALAIYQRIGAPEAGRTEKILLSEGSLPGNTP